MHGRPQTSLLRFGGTALTLLNSQMDKLIFTTGLLLGTAMALVSCVPPKAVIVAQAPVTKKVVKQQEPTVAEAPIPALPGDEIRMPSDMVGLPTDADFRATTPVAPVGSGSVFVRPPTDPPSRVKPKPAE